MYDQIQFASKVVKEIVEENMRERNNLKAEAERLMDLLRTANNKIYELKDELAKLKEK